MSMDLEKIIETAKQQESWSANHKWNYGPIDYLEKHVVYAFESIEVGLAVFMNNVHRVTDAETYFVYEHKGFDIYVDADLMVCKMRRAFPDVSFKQVVEWLNKHEEPHQYTNGISKSLVPKEFLNGLKSA